MILLEIASIKTWKPLSKTTKLDKLFDQVPDQIALQIERDFAQWLTELLRYQVRQAIHRQIFPVQYAPLSHYWADKKKKKGWHAGFWRASSFLVDNLQTWQANGSSYLGWPPGLKHPESGSSVSAIAISLEKGNADRGLPPRPLFTPLAENVSKSIVPKFREFIQRHYPQYLHYVQEMENPSILRPKSPLIPR